MVDHLKNFDLSSPEVRQQFGEWINTCTFTWILLGSWNMWILQEISHYAFSLFKLYENCEYLFCFAFPTIPVCYIEHCIDQWCSFSILIILSFQLPSIALIHAPVILVLFVNLLVSCCKRLA
jgi:hypothetical protein